MGVGNKSVFEPTGFLKLTRMDIGYKWSLGHVLGVVIDCNITAFSRSI